jgi:hypothetical protein
MTHPKRVSKSYSIVDVNEATTVHLGRQLLAGFVNWF